MDRWTEDGWRMYDRWIDGSTYGWMVGRRLTGPSSFVSVDGHVSTVNQTGGAAHSTLEPDCRLSFSTAFSSPCRSAQWTDQFQWPCSATIVRSVLQEMPAGHGVVTSPEMARTPSLPSGSPWHMTTFRTAPSSSYDSLSGMKRSRPDHTSLSPPYYPQDSETPWWGLV